LKLDTLPYTLPTILYSSLLSDLASSFNLLPNANLPTQSPFTVVTGRKVSYKDDTKFPFGAVVIVSSPEGHVSEGGPKGVIGIVIGRERGVRGGMRIYLPSSGVMVTRKSAKAANATADVINLINKKAAESRQQDDVDRVVRMNGEVVSPQPLIEDTIPPGMVSTLSADAMEFRPSRVHPTSSPPLAPTRQATAPRSLPSPRVTARYSPTVTPPPPTAPQSVPSPPVVISPSATAPQSVSSPPTVIPPVPRPASSRVVAPTTRVAAPKPSSRGAGNGATVLPPSRGAAPPPAPLSTATVAQPTRTKRSSVPPASLLPTPPGGPLAESRALESNSRYPSRERKTTYKNVGKKSGFVSFLTVKQASRSYPTLVDGAMRTELRQLRERGTFVPVHGAPKGEKVVHSC
jgi:hypothetical protein